MSEMDYEKALAAFEKAIEIESHCAEGYLGMAEAYISQGETEKAIAILEKRL